MCFCYDDLVVSNVFLFCIVMSERAVLKETSGIDTAQFDCKVLELAFLSVDFF